MYSNKVANAIQELLKAAKKKSDADVLYNNRKFEEALEMYYFAYSKIKPTMRNEEEFELLEKQYKDKLQRLALQCLQGARECMDMLTEDPEYDKFVQKLLRDCVVTEFRDDTFENMIGLEEVKEELMEKIVIPFELPNLYDAERNEETFVLSFGPPGTFKTAVCYAVYNKLKDVIKKFFVIGHGFIHNRYKGDSAKAVTALFKVIRKNKPCMVLIDEVESILGTPRDQDVDDGVIQTFLTELDPKKPENQGVIVFCCTNHPELLAPGFHRRFSCILYHGMPTKQVINQNVDNK